MRAAVGSEEVAKRIALRYALVTPNPRVLPEHSVGRDFRYATFLLVIGTALLLMFPLFPLTVYSRSYVWFITLSLAKENFVPKFERWVERITGSLSLSQPTSKVAKVTLVGFSTSPLRNRWVGVVTLHHLHILKGFL